MKKRKLFLLTGLIFSFILGSCGSAKKLAAPEINYDGETLSWTSENHSSVSAYYLCIDGEYAFYLGNGLKYEMINILLEFLNWSDGLRHTIQVRAVGSNGSWVSDLSNGITKLEAPMVNEAYQEIINKEMFTWQPVEDAIGYRVIVDNQETIVDASVTTFDYSPGDKSGYYVRIQALHEKEYLSSELIPTAFLLEKFGTYPQTVVDDTSTISALNAINETNKKGYYVYGGNEYAKVKGNPYDRNYTFSNGQIIGKGQTYYFKVEPIKWRGLEKKDGTLTLLTDMIIDQQQFYSSYDGRTIDGKRIDPNNYEHSTIRKWLNNDFYNEAFNEDNKKYIKTAFVDNSIKTVSPYGGHGRELSNNTNDKVYLISYHEAYITYFYKDSHRQAIATDYARARNVYVSANNYSYWWTRSPYSFNYASYVNNSGALSYDGVSYHGTIGGVYFEESNNGVRPALQIKMS